MDMQQVVKLSKYLSKHLRHQPERLGLTLEPGGWVAVDDLLAACARHQVALSRNLLEEVVRQNDKQRFSFDATGQRIRANQGHSTPVDLALPPAAPPALLYHGTSRRNVGAIEAGGLSKMSRHHVHLSADIETALRVGGRHGQPVVFEIDTVAMQADGAVFYCSENKVWLVDAVPPCFLRSRAADARG